MACKTCANKVRRPGIDAALAVGISAEQVARDQTETGFSITAAAIAQHKRHSVPPPEVVHPGIKGRDLAIVVRDMTLDAVESGAISPLDDKLWKNVSPGLAAQKILDQREAKKDDRKVIVAFGLMIAGGSQRTAPAALLGDGMTIEGEAEEVAYDE